MKKKLLLVLLLVFILVFSGCSLLKKLDNSATKLTSADFAEAFDAESADLAYTRVIEDDIKGLSDSDALKLVLVCCKDKSGKTTYGLCAADYERNEITLFDYGNYAPLEILYEEHIIYFSPKAHSDNADIIYEYIVQYGFYCFDNYDVADKYIMRLTKNNDLIDLDDARHSIEKYISTKETALDIYNEIEIIYKGDSAVPQYYAYKTRNSSGKWKWYALDRNFDEVPGVGFDSFYKLEAFLTGKEVEDYNFEHDYEDEEEKPDIDKPDVYKPEIVEENTPKPNAGNNNSSAQSQVFYRVRKSAYDAQSQIGAFNVLENAINLAVSRRAEGYKVYDSYGNLIYAP